MVGYNQTTPILLKLLSTNNLIVHHTGQPQRVDKKPEAVADTGVRELL